MYLLKKGTFEFSKLMRGGYEIREDVRKVLSTSKTASGVIKRTIAKKRTTFIKLTFDAMNETDLALYLNAFDVNTASFEYWSPKRKAYCTRTFAVEEPTVTLLYSEGNKKYSELKVSMEDLSGV
jgi:hypothetical protein